MHSSSHRLNHDFQLRHFIAGSCKTPDGAYCILYAQMIDMQSKLKTGEAQGLERKIKRMKAQRLVESDDEIDQMEGLKELTELEASAYIWEMNVKGAEQELATIQGLMTELEPLRQYAHLDILAANEACQREEWLLELMARAENNLLAHGSIPPDQLDTMRMHPDFQTDIVPHVLKLTESIKQNGVGLMSKITSPSFLLEHK